MDPCGSGSATLLYSHSLLVQKVKNHYFLYEKYKSLLFRTKKDFKKFTFLYEKRYTSLLFPANMYKSLLFLTRKLGIIMFSYKNGNLFNRQSCTLYTVQCTRTVYCAARLLIHGNYCSTLESQSAESCSIGSPVLCR